MIVLVCGGRAYTNEMCVDRVLGALHSKHVIALLIEGGALGADRLAFDWAKRAGVHSARVNALWGVYGRAAGYRRNKAMLLLRPDMVVAFPGGPGTADMRKQAEAAGVKLMEVPSEAWME